MGSSSVSLLTLLLLVQYLVTDSYGTLFEDPLRRSACVTSGGTCESLFSCLVSVGIAASSCGGFLAVCCVRPASVNRWLNDNRQNDIRDFYPTEKRPVINDPKCGIRPQTANRRVIDGEDAGFGTFPWQALVRIGKAKCGGVLVNRQHIITAGHCIKNKNIHAINVTLGEYHIDGLFLEDGEIYPSQTYKIESAVVHPKFQFSPAADRYDVAVLRLQQPVYYAPHIAPICLPRAGKDPEAGTVAYATGWGAIIPDDKLGPFGFLVPKEKKRPKVLQVVDVPLVENSQCENWHSSRGISVILYPEMMCAGYKSGGKDSCKGDSGGPLMVRQQDGRWVLVGLVSAGFSCGQPGQPGIYHRISHTADWISEQVNGRL